MPTELQNLTPLAIVFIFAIRELFLFLKSRKNGNNGNYKLELSEINEKLNNHMLDYKQELKDENNRLTSMETDIKIIKNTLSDIKIKMK